jgi:hypothetical protein
MPLARYFFLVGGVLLALLWISDAVLPKVPMAAGTDLGTEKSFLRINSDRKWPERVVFDTSIPPVAAVQTATIEKAVTPPLIDPVVDVSPNTREAFAQLEPSDPKKPEPKPQRKRRIVKKHVGPATVLIAQQPRFGFFVSNIW